MFRSLFVVPRRQVLVFIAVLMLAASAGAIAWYSHAAAEAKAVASVDSSSADVAEAGDDGQSGADILLGLAREAMHDGRLVAPQGSNAFEFYLSVLQLDPDNRTAQEALRESFARAAVEIEGTINRNELEEARREIDLLREFDRDNFTLALLGGKLAAAWNVLSKQHEAEAERIRQANAVHASP